MKKKTASEFEYWNKGLVLKKNRNQAVNNHIFSVFFLTGNKQTVIKKLLTN
jgi:hypothetical protein